MPSLIDIRRRVRATKSNKPTRVLEDIRIAAPRPRNLHDDPALAAIKTRLQDLFRSLEPATTEDSPS